MSGHKTFEYTEQEAFDRVVAKLAKQGRRSVNPTGLCLYFSSTDCRCAAGWLMLPEEFHPWYEGQKWPPSPALKRRAPHRFVRELQYIHDNEDDLAQWPTRFRELAEKYRLDASIIDRVWGVPEGSTQ